MVEKLVKDDFEEKKIVTIKDFTMAIAIIIAIVLGVFAGKIFGESAKSLEIFPKIFMWFIKNLTPYLIFLAISSGILSIGSLDQLRRLGLKAAAVYIGSAIFAVIIGIWSGIIFAPGIGFAVPEATPLVETSFVDTILASPLLSLVVMTILLSVATLAAKEFYEQKLSEVKNKNAVSAKNIEPSLNPDYANNGIEPYFPPKTFSLCVPEKPHQSRSSDAYSDR